MNQIIKLFIFSLLSIHVFAGEIDHTLVWGHPLQDSRIELNLYFNDEINMALSSLPDDCDCETAALKILAHFGVALNSPLENLIKESSKFDKFPNPHMAQEERYKNSIYKKSGSAGFELRQNYTFDYMIDEIININGIYIGIDKLSHFTGSGYLYFQRYKQRINKGDSEIEAIEQSILLGVIGEKTILGRYSSGVFSFADLEANFQGFSFAVDLCRGTEAMFLKQGRRWILDRPFDIADYVNPYWDESFNPSFYYEGQNLTFLNKSETVLNNLPRTCKKFHSASVQNLFKYYAEQADPSFSVKFLNKLILTGKVPDPALFDLRYICPPERISETDKLINMKQ